MDGNNSPNKYVEVHAYDGSALDTSDSSLTEQDIYNAYDDKQMFPLRFTPEGGPVGIYDLSIADVDAIFNNASHTVIAGVYQIQDGKLGTSDASSLQPMVWISIQCGCLLLVRTNYSSANRGRGYYGYTRSSCMVFQIPVMDNLLLMLQEGIFELSSAQLDTLTGVTDHGLSPGVYEIYHGTMTDSSDASSLQLMKWNTSGDDWMPQHGATNDRNWRQVEFS